MIENFQKYDEAWTPAVNMDALIEESKRVILNEYEGAGDTDFAIQDITDMIKLTIMEKTDQQMIELYLQMKDFLMAMDEAGKRVIDQLEPKPVDKITVKF
jgi:hypothetical protein